MNQCIRLKERRAEAPDAMSFIFDLDGRPYPYRPGQYAYFILDKLALRDKLGPVRHFTLSSSPTEKGIIMFTTRLRGSGYKETLRRAPLGLEVTLKPAEGKFVLPKGRTRSHVFIAGGIGITPFRSILRNAADSGKTLDARLLYFNRSPESVVFRRELEDISRCMPTFKMKMIFDEPAPADPAENGKRRESAVRPYIDRSGKTLFWVSGPPAMAEAYGGLLERLGVPARSIRTEGLSGYEPEEVFPAGLKAGAGGRPSRKRPSFKEKSMTKPSFAADLLPLFRKFDINKMKREGLDLSSYDQVKKKAGKIYTLLKNGEMPCDKPWAKERLAAFKRWIDEGKKP